MSTRGARGEGRRTRRSRRGGEEERCGVTSAATSVSTCCWDDQVRRKKGSLGTVWLWSLAPGSKLLEHVWSTEGTSHRVTWCGDAFFEEGTGIRVGGV